MAYLTYKHVSQKTDTEEMLQSCISSLTWEDNYDAYLGAAGDFPDSKRRTREGSTFGNLELYEDIMDRGDAFIDFFFSTLKEAADYRKDSLVFVGRRTGCLCDGKDVWVSIYSDSLFYLRDHYAEVRADTDNAMKNFPKIRAFVEPSYVQDIRKSYNRELSYADILERLEAKGLLEDFKAYVSDYKQHLDEVSDILDNKGIYFSESFWRGHRSVFQDRMDLYRNVSGWLMDIENYEYKQDKQKVAEEPAAKVQQDVEEVATASGVNVSLFGDEASQAILSYLKDISKTLASIDDKISALYKVSLLSKETPVSTDDKAEEKEEKTDGKNTDKQIENKTWENEFVLFDVSAAMSYMNDYCNDR